VTAPLRSRPARYGTVLRNREFFGLVVAHTVSLLGTTIAAVALAVLIFERTRSPFLSSLTFALGFTPYLLGGLLSPRLEHLPPRRLMIACDLFQGSIYAVMAVPGLPVPVLLALLGLGSMAAPIFSGTRAGLLPSILGEGEGFVLGRSVLRLIAQSGQILGLAVGGALLLVVDARVAVLAVAGTCGVSAVLIRVGIRDHRPAMAHHDAGSRGVTAVLDDPRRRRLLLLDWVVPMAAVAPEALAVPYVVGLGFPAASAGLLLWAAPAGAIFGEVVTARLFRPDVRARTVVPLTAVVLLVPLAFAVQPPLPVAIGVLLVSSAGFGFSLGLDQQLMAATPVTLQRRTLTVATAGLMFFQGLGFALAGAAAEFAAPHVVIPVVSLLGLVALIALRRSVRR
jgi:MFS family permease